MKKSLQNLAFLNEVHLRINIREDLQTNLYSLFSFCQQFLPFDYCGILTENGIDKNYSPLFLFPHHEFNSTAVNSEFAKGHFATKKSIYSNSLKDEGRFKYHFMTNRKDENSLLVAPLHSATNEFEGVIIALSKNKNFFVEDDLSLFEYLSKLIVLLLQIYQAQNTTISAIRQYDKELYSELRNTKKVMDKLIECSVKITGADYGCLVRYNDLKRQLECRYADGCAKMGKDKKEKCIFNLN